MACAALPARADTWIDDEDFFTESTAAGGSYIAQYFKETRFEDKFPATGHVFEAQALAIALPVDFASVLSSLTKTLTNGMGIASVTRRDDVNLAKAWDPWIDDDNIVQVEAKAKWERDLSNSGVGTEFLTAARVESNRYNRLSNRNGFSRATFLIFDGKKVYGKSCTVMVIYRTDHVEQWGFQSIHNPFSFDYEVRLFHLVTNTESAILESLTNNAGVKYSPTLIPFASSWFSDANLWITLGKQCGPRS
jgi:hypothetical protein